MKTTVTIFELNALQPGKAVTIHLVGRGVGSLVFKGGKNATTAFFRVRSGGQDSLIKIGRVGKTDEKKKNETISSLKEILSEANRLYELAATIPDLKQHLDDEKIKGRLEAEQRKKKLKDIERQEKIEASRGSLSDLFLNYIENSSVAPEGKAELRRVLKKELNENNQEVALKKARDIIPDDIISILRKIEARGSSGMADKMRSYLGAAYQLELDRKHSYRHSKSDEDLKFELTHNPVALIPKQYGSKAVERALTDAELQQFYHTVSSTKGISENMGLLFMLNIQLGGQRILQLSRAAWCDYDLDKRLITIIDKKGKPRKGQEKKERKHIIPLTKSAMKLIDRLKVITSGFEYPFSSEGTKPFRASSFSHATSEWLRSKNGNIDGTKVNHFTPRDLRRTCTQLIKRMGIDQGQSDALQSHGLNGVVMEHYLNNPELFVSDKIAALKTYERRLNKILNGKVSGGGGRDATQSEVPSKAPKEELSPSQNTKKSGQSRTPTRKLE